MSQFEPINKDDETRIEVATKLISARFQLGKLSEP
jgi:hypothetical protein